MSTHCFVCYLDKSERLEAIYISHDGYFAGVGSILMRDYLNEKDVIQLFIDGSRSSLSEDTKKEGNLFYDSKRIYSNLHELEKDIKKRKDIEFAYIWKEEDQKWYYLDNDYTTLVLLEKVTNGTTRFNTAMTSAKMGVVFLRPRLQDTVDLIYDNQT
jgi:hypothetical protein